LSDPDVYTLIEVLEENYHLDMSLKAEAEQYRKMKGA